MEKLSKLPNIGKVIEIQLKSVGIDTIEDFKCIGSKAAWLKLQRLDSTVCIDELYALEGAVKGVRWFNLEQEVKEDLKEFYKAHQL